jgi:homoserine dehydrogenase
VDVVIICTPASALVYPLIASALNAGKFVITANKAAVAAHGAALARHTRGDHRRLWYSAAVGGALPALETLATLSSPVREIRGIINGTCGVVLDQWAAGKTRDEAVAVAQAAGFAETNPARDLSGRDSADKLALMTEAAFGQWLAPEEIPTFGIDTITGDPQGYRLIARAKRTPDGITASVAPESPPPDSFLGQARGPENRLEIELETGGVVRLRGQGAGRRPTTVSVMGDLHEVARNFRPSAPRAAS